MLRPFLKVALAVSVWATVLAMPVLAKDSDAVATPVSAVSASPAAASAVTARAQTAAPAAKRIRRAQPRRVAVATPVAYHPQCFLFWCTAGGRPYNFLMLGVAY